MIELAILILTALTLQTDLCTLPGEPVDWNVYALEADHVRVMRWRDGEHDFDLYDDNVLFVYLGGSVDVVGVDGNPHGACAIRLTP